MKNKYLIHYNHNHDARGRFAKSNGQKTTYRETTNFKNESESRSLNNINDKNEIYRTWSKKEKKYYFGTDKKENATDLYEYKNNYHVYSLIVKNQDKPVAFLDVHQGFGNDADKAYVSIGVSKDNRGKGYGKTSVDKGKEWFDSHPEYDTLIWVADKHNKASRKLAEKSGFTRDENAEKERNDGDVVYTIKRKKR